jgi:hypothetical protein
VVALLSLEVSADTVYAQQWPAVWGVNNVVGHMEGPGARAFGDACCLRSTPC